MNANLDRMLDMILEETYNAEEIARVAEVSVDTVKEVAITFGVDLPGMVA